MNTLVFDIETVPDVEFGRRLFGLDGLSDEEVGKAMQARSRQESGSDFLPHEQHRIVAISCAFRSRDGFRVWSLGDEGASEREPAENDGNANQEKSEGGGAKRNAAYFAQRKLG